MTENKNSLSELRIDISKDQLGAVLRAMSPFRAEDNIRLTFTPSNLIFEAEETGNTGKIVIGNESVTEDMEGINFFLSRNVLGQIYNNMPNLSTFTFKKNGEYWSEVAVTIGGDVINIGLPIFEKPIDTSYTEAQAETVLSEIFNNALNRVSASLIGGAAPTGCIEIGNTLKFGSAKSISYYSNLLKTLEVKVSPEFRRFLSNLFRIGGTTEIVTTTDNQVVFRCENVEYKTSQVKHTIPDVESLLDSSKPCEFVCGFENLKMSLSRLSIPLSGTEASVSLTVKGSQLTLEVFDIQGRKSTSDINLVSVSGEGKTKLPIGDLQALIQVFEQDATMSFRKTPDDDDIAMIEIKDSVQTAYVSTEV